jgi:hypothetical protein
LLPPPPPIAANEAGSNVLVSVDDDVSDRDDVICWVGLYGDDDAADNLLDDFIVVVAAAAVVGLAFWSCLGLHFGNKIEICSLSVFSGDSSSSIPVADGFNKIVVVVAADDDDNEWAVV